MNPNEMASVGVGNTSFMRFIYGALTAMGMFITAFDKHDHVRDKWHMDIKGGNDAIETYDFIIVGGGTAGSIVANRLSDKYKVLLLEAGGEPFPFQSIPALAPYMMRHKEIDWNFQTVPQKDACQALNEQKSYICQGKGLGGSSNMGPLNFLRGSPFDYESWANMTGDIEWRYSALLPYFKRMEDYQGLWTNPETHGFDGELQLQSPNYTTALADRFIRAGMEMNYKLTDLNGIYTEGFDYLLSPLRRGYRQTTTTAYLNSIRPRHKLTIKKYANVQKILFRKDVQNNDTNSSSQPAAYGVVYQRHGELGMAVASKEVILSAGAINTPKLLMLSGIGPKAILEHFKLPIVKELPVGKNLQDHLVTYLGPFMLNTSSSESFLMDRDLTAESVAQFGLINGQGPLTSTGLQGNAHLVSSREKMRGNIFWPDLHLSLYGLSHHTSIDEEFINMFNLAPEIAETYFNRSKGVDSFSIIISGARPHSRGRVRLSSKSSSSSNQVQDQDEMPLINPNYLSDPRDLNVMIDGIYRALSLVENSKAFQELGATLSEHSFPSCTSMEFRSKEYWECYVKAFSMSANHFVGSCSMGKKDTDNASGNIGGVVDGKLKVIGVDNIRIIDASVIPSIPVGGTLAPTMVVAEKGADVILNHWNEIEMDAS